MEPLLAAAGLAPGLVVGSFLNVVAARVPDGRSVVVKDTNRKESRLIDSATGGDGLVLDWAGDGFTGWQRLAP